MNAIANRLQFHPHSFNQSVLVDTTPMPADIPKVDEIGATSAPLTSAAYFIGDRCSAFNDDYMKCKSEAKGRGELECMKEGRKVTRCAATVYVFFPPLCSGCGWGGDGLIGAGSKISTPTACSSSTPIGNASRTTTRICGNVESPRCR